MFKRGQIVRCIEKPGYLDGFSRNTEYVVVDTEQHHGASYIKILGDDDRAHMLLDTMFRSVEVPTR